MNVSSDRPPVLCRWHPPDGMAFRQNKGKALAYRTGDDDDQPGTAVT
jgi:hypothetical protein